MTLVLTAAALMMSAGSSAMAQSWQPAPGPLSTRWAKDVSPDKALPEYPRPQLVRKQWTNLNGLWDFAIAGVHDPVPTKWDGKILVPFAIESSLSGVGKPVAPNQVLWYKRSLNTAKPAGNNRCLLHFGAVDWHAQVWLNGQMLAEHRGGFDPFSCDLTDAMTSSDSQELIVRVWDPSDAGSQPRGKQVQKPQGIFYTSVTGIWQTVWTENVPADHIRSVRITPDFDASKVNFTVNVAGKRNANVQLVVSDAGKEIAKGEGTAGSTVSISIPNFKPWSPDAPHLYDVTIQIGGDSVQSYFGMRKISMGKDAQGTQRMWLNGKPLFQMGPLDQGWWPDGLYTAPTDEALKFDIEVTRQMGFNMARKHVKVEPDRWYYWADKLGLLVWQDMPSLMAKGQAQQVKRGGADDILLTAQETMQYQSEWRAIMDACYNHPSIVVWVPFNEGWGQHTTNDILKWTKSYDPTRLVDGPSGWEDRGWGEMKDMHEYPGPGMYPVMDDRISVLGEFGGLGLPIEKHLWQSDRNWGYRNMKTRDELASRYRDLIRRLHALIGKGCAAAVYTQTTDVEGEVNGLLTYDREIIKIDPQQLSQWHKQLEQPAPEEVVLAGTSQSSGETWTFTMTQPEGDWTKPDYKATQWQSGPGGFGTASTPNSHVRTTWDKSDIWLRREFTISEPLPSESVVFLSVFHDEDAEIYINGVEAIRLEGHTGSYGMVPVAPAAAQALRQGKNTIAVHCRQTTGGQYIDVGLIQLKPAR